MKGRVRKFKELIGFDNDLQSIQDLDVLLEKILINTRKFVNADAGTIYVKKGENLAFSHTQNDELQKQLPRHQKLPYAYFTVPINPKSICGYVAYEKKILNLPDVYQLPPNTPYSFNSSYDKETNYTTSSMLTIPLVTNLGEVLGVIQVINAKDKQGKIVPFNAEDELFVSHFANNATIALQRAQLTRQIILRMIRMAELRDPKETGAHVNRVASIAVEIYERWAKKKNLPSYDIQKAKDVLRMAAMLHDVGKVAISDVILKKPGRFTADEYEIIKTHTMHGAQLFSSMQSNFDAVASSVALTHHQNWDGTGYPPIVDKQTGKIVLDFDKTDDVRPMKGEEIPVFGRVVALADVYDALSFHRVYKEPWGHKEVCEEIAKLSGRKFDPELVDIFFESIDHIKSVAVRYPDQETGQYKG